MLPEERKRTIVDVVDDEGGCSVATLATELDVSKATIRRDLRDLEEEGLLERSHGGAVPARTVASEQTYGQRGIQDLDAKRAIGARAVEEIHDGHVVFFDGGTTTMQVAQLAPANMQFIAATNSPPTAMELVDTECEVKLTGGTLREQTYALVGPTGERFLERTNFDTLFLGTNGLDPEVGLTTPNEDEARMKSLMVEKASRVVLVADETKLGRRSFVQFAAYDDVDLFVTDASLSATDSEPFDAAGVEVVEVDVE